MAQAKQLHAVRMAVSFRDAGVRQVYLLRTAKVTRVLRLPQAWPSRPAGVAHRACLFHAQTASRLTMMLSWRRVRRVPVSRERRTKLLEHQLRLLDLCRRPEQGCLLRALRRELAAARSWDFLS
jgi:hypothetical protein